MKDIIEEKLRIGKVDNTYQRVDSEHPIDIFIGYDENGYKSLAITGETLTKNLVSTSIISVSSKKRYDNKIQLIFSLTDDSFISLFLHYCEDVINSSKNISSAIVLDFLVGRWNYWRKMFKVTNSDLLSDSVIKGLVGELLFLNKKMFGKYEVASSIAAWMGPEMAHKDFEINDDWYEVKSTDSSSASIKISSLSQLDAENEGRLAVVLLDKASPENTNSYNLNSCVSNTLLKINDESVADEFMNKLAEMGYFYDIRYDNICYALKSITQYKVNDNFPRMTATDISTGITNVSYSVLLQSISQFIVKED